VKPGPSFTRPLWLALWLAASGCTTSATPTPAPPEPASASGSASPTAPATGEVPAATIEAVSLWLDPEFAPDAAPRLQAILDGWRASHPEARLDVAIRPARGATAASTFLGAVFNAAPARLPDVVMVPLDAVPAINSRGLAADLGAGPIADRVAGAFPLAARLSTAADGTARAVPIALDVAHLVGSGDRVTTWEALAPEDRIVAPSPAAEPAALALALAAFAAADGQLEELAAPDGAALTVAFGALETAYGRGQVRASDAQLPLGLLAEVVGARAALVTAGGYVQHAAQPGDAGWPAGLPELGTATWSPLPGIDAAAPPIAWGWGLIIPQAASANRSLVLDLVDRLSRPQANDWVMEHGHLPAYPEAFEAVFANPSLPEAATAYAGFLAEQLTTASAIALPEADWERWRVAVAALFAGQGATAAVGALEPER